MDRHHHHHHPQFPRAITRFFQLEGGQYGTVEMTALTAHKLEVQLGADFVQFTRKQAEDLRDAVQTFLDLGAEHPPRPHGSSEEVVEKIEEIVERREIVEEVPRRRRRRGRQA